MHQCPKFRRLVFSVPATIALVATLTPYVRILLPGNTTHIPEYGAISALKQCATAQQMYGKRNFSAANSGRPNEYCRSFRQLGGPRADKGPDGTRLELVNHVHAAATSPTSGYQGYYYIDAAVSDPATQYGLFAVPCVYGGPHTLTLYIDQTGTVMEKDMGGQAATASTSIDSSWYRYGETPRYLYWRPIILWDRDWWLIAAGIALATVLCGRFAFLRLCAIRPWANSGAIGHNLSSPLQETRVRRHDR